MTMFLAPYTAIADIDGSPLDAGFLFFGEYEKDPELFPIEVFWDAEFTVPAAQPIRTRNGYPVRNGSPTKVYLKTAQHSIVIKNRNGAFILVDFKNKGWNASFVVDASGQTQQEINNNQVVLEEKKARDYVTPYDYGYTDGLDYGHYLQLAIDSGKTVKGSYINEVVRADTSVVISKDGQEVDLSMLTVELNNIAGAENRSVGFVNLRPEILDPFVWITASGAMPEVFANSFTLSDASSLAVGDYILISVTHAAENSISRPAFITAKSGNTISTDYIFGVQPATLRVSKVNYVQSCVVKMPMQLIDLATGTTTEAEMVGGLRVERGVGCELYGTELVNGANPALLYVYSHSCTDRNFKTTNPRIKTAGRGYAVQVGYSTKIESYNPTGYRSRHIIDYTGSCYCNNYNANEPKPEYPPLLTHGAYEHDINYISPRTGDCAAVSGGYAVSFAGADAHFGNVSLRCKVLDALCGGGFWLSPTSKNCDIEGNFKTSGFNQASCAGGITLKVDTNSSGVIVTSSAGVGDITLDDSKIANLVLQENIGAVTVKNSTVKDIRTDGTTKPVSIDIIDKSTLNPTFSVTNTITTQKHFKIDNTEVNGMLVNAGYYIVSPIVSIGALVDIRKSVNFHAVASDYFNFQAKHSDVDTNASRTAGVPLVQQRSATGQLIINSAKLLTSGGNNIVPFRVSSTSQAFVSAPLIVTGSYVEGVTEVPNHISLGKMDTMVLSGNIFKDDAAILAISETAKIKITGNVKL